MSSEFRDLKSTLHICGTCLLTLILLIFLYCVKIELGHRPTLEQIDAVLVQVGREVDRLDKNNEKLLDLVGPLLKGKIKKAEPKEEPKVK